MANPSEALNLAARILELQKEVVRLQPLQKELRSLEAKWAALFPNDESAAVADESQPSGSLVKQILGALGQNAGRKMGAEDIAGLIPDSNLMSVRSALARLAKNEQIERGDRGQYFVKPAQPTLVEESSAA